MLPRNGAKRNQNSMQQRRRKPNARKRAHVPARRSRPVIRTIDIHAHFVPEEYLRFIEAEGEPHGVRLRSGPNGPMIVVGQAIIGPITAHYHDLASTPESNGRAEGSSSCSLAHAADGVLGGWCSRCPARQLVNDAMAEANRAIPTASWFLPRFPCKIPKPLSQKWYALSQSSAVAASISARMFAEKS